MVYIKVLVASNSYRGNEALTYSAKTNVAPGSIVLVPLRRSRVSAIVVGKTTKPTFPTKPILTVQVSHPLPKPTLQLLEWLGNYYPAPSGTIVSQFLPSSLLVKKNIPLETPKQTMKKLPTLPPLTTQQAETLAIIDQRKVRTCLIHGDTGTGKTRLYIELARKILRAGQSVLVLTPEIGLTPQLAQNLQDNLEAPILVVHSNLTPQERRKLWLRALTSKEALVVVGPRSALFTPLSSIGLIIVDEAHDNAYKQEQAPRYHALRVAGRLAELHKAKLIFGTATPLVNEYYYLSLKKIPIVRLTEIAAGNEHPPLVKVVDGQDRSQYTRSPFLSDIMLNEISQSLDDKRQSLVFLNRRGTARIVMCQNGDWQAHCPRCDIPLTYHGDSHIMRCHTCGYKSRPVSSCPKCSSTDIVFRSIGTKAVAETLSKIFPDARIKRFDTDNSKDDRLELNYVDVRAGKIDIMVGTQLLIKGLDLPSLSTIGVVAADSSLYFPDFTAEEQTYQLLTQVIGRVGRGHGRSSVVIQTYNPFGRALSAVLNKDWPSFYSNQLEERKKHGFPPFYFVLKLSASRKSQAAASSAVQKLKTDLLTCRLPIEVDGPAPHFQEFLRGEYHWQLLVKAKDRRVLIKVISLLPSGWTYDMDPLNLL